MDNYMTDQYSELSLKITNELDKNTKKQFGIFITPKDIINKLLVRVNYFINDTKFVINTILEPSCGSCEIINGLIEIFIDKELDAF